MPERELKNSEFDRFSGLPGALVLGGGLSGLIAAKALIEVEIGVTLVKTDSPGDALYCAAAEFNRNTYIEGLSEATKGAAVVEVENWPKLRRHGFGFLADFGNGSESFHGCVFLTSGLSLRSAGTDFPEGVEIISSQSRLSEGHVQAFLLDCNGPAHPATGMAAIRQAIDNREAGGESFILFKHAPVAHLFGEALYETARRKGVRFFRCSEDGAEVVAISPAAEKGPRFRVTFLPTIRGEDRITLDCDRVIVSGRPDPALIPRRAIETAEYDVNEEGYLLSSGTQSRSGRSFRNGIFAVGEATGEADLLRTIAQASAAAATARAWMLHASAEQERDTVSSTEECIRCLTCLRICPHTAMHLSASAARSTYGAVAGLCQECGICVAECPRLVLDLTSFPEAAIRSFVEEVKRVQDSRPIVVYGCARSAGRAAAQIKMPQGILFFSVPCAGRVSETVLWATLAAGARGVLVVGCHHGNCSSESGTDWARARVESTAEKLGDGQAVDVPVKFAALAAIEPSRFCRIINEFASSLHCECDLVTAVS